MSETRIVQLTVKCKEKSGKSINASNEKLLLRGETLEEQRERSSKTGYTLLTSLGTRLMRNPFNDLIY
jgi:hypothetical protein